MLIIRQKQIFGVGVLSDEHCAQDIEDMISVSPFLVFNHHDVSDYTHKQMFRMQCAMSNFVS